MLETVVLLKGLLGNEMRGRLVCEAMFRSLRCDRAVR